MMKPSRCRKEDLVREQRRPTDSGALSRSGMKRLTSEADGTGEHGDSKALRIEERRTSGADGGHMDEHFVFKARPITDAEGT